MIKFTGFIARPAGMTVAAFQQYWQEVHAPLAREMPGLRGYVLSIPLESHSRSDVKQMAMADFDGVAQLWFDDAESAAASGATAAGLRLRDDNVNFIGALRRFVTEEQVVVPLPDGPRPGVKSLTVIRRRPDATPEQFQQAWRVGHAKMAPGVPHIRGFVLSGILAEAPNAPGIPLLDMPTPIDGIAESWCDDMESRRALVASPAAKEWFADGATFLGEVRTVLLREVVVIPPPR